MLIDRLPTIPALRRVTQSLAMLDAILCHEWQYRYYSFNSMWSPGEEMASMRNGSGDDWFLLFDAAGAAIKGFAHELAGSSELSQAIQQQVPKNFSSFLKEPAFSLQHATFCYWRQADEISWSKVSGANGEDGSEELLALLVSGPASYRKWAAEYYEVLVPIEAVEALFSHQPLTDALILALNPGADLEFAYTEAEEIGYPCSPA